MIKVAVHLISLIMTVLLRFDQPTALIQTLHHSDWCMELL